MKKQIFTEQYEVSIDYKKPDGYWAMSHKVHINIPLVGVAAENEKGNHDLAVKVVKQMFPNCLVNSVTYC